MTFDRADYINRPIPIENELKTLFHQNDALTIFEIGACEGEDSIKYARLFPNSKVYAFEPLPDNIKWIEENIARYNIRNIDYYNKALSSKEGTAEFFVSEGRPENAEQTDWDFGNKSSSLLPPGQHLNLVDFIRFNKRIEVETITLKSFCEANNIRLIDFIHMDVQGAELMVLEGAGDFITKIKTIWLEVSKVHLYKDQPLVNDIQKYMTKNNFALVKDAVEDIQGDRLYVSKAFYPNYKSLISNKPNAIKSLIKMVLKKLGRS